MKTISCIIILMLASLCLRAQVLELHGIIKGAPDGTLVRIMDYDKEPEAIIDSVSIKDGEFLYKADRSWKHPKYLHLDFLTADRKDENRRKTSFFAESGPMTFECPFECLPSYFWNPETKPYEPVFKGAVTEEAYMDYKKYISAASMALGKTEGLYFSLYGQKDMDRERAMKLVREIDRLETRKLEVISTYIMEHPASVVSLLAFCRMMYSYPGILTQVQVERLYRSLSPSLQDADAMEKVKSYLQRGKDLAKGCPYHDAEVLNLQGEKVRLSDFIKPGMYHMLEFWASWCSPCRGEIPHLKRIYELSKGKNFNIISISIDEKQEDWHKAVQEEGMGWTQLRCSEGWKSGIARKYYVSGVPFSVILDPQGRIVKTDVRGVELDVLLEDLAGIRSK